MKRHNFPARHDPHHPQHETYAVEFCDMQKLDDQARWVGTLTDAEFPHNKGALEAKIDKEQRVTYTELENAQHEYGQYGKKGY